MERLTERRDALWVIPLREDGKYEWALCQAGISLNDSTKYLYGYHADRLAAYEDTGLEPEEIMQLLHTDNPPLTLEELREMDGPVWCKVDDCAWIPEGGYWCLLSKGNLLTPSGERFTCEELADWRWPLYRRKPEEGET